MTHSFPTRLSSDLDLLHMLVNLSVIQFTAEFLAKLGDAVPASVRLFPIESPLWLQLLLVAAVLDLSLYVMHRISHRVHWLWRFHMIHHSRSEEHTSELQSLMRISYAVFCLH